MLAVLAATLLAREAVRQDMEREQRETGLTLETFERKIRSINFGTRLPEQRELNLKLVAIRSKVPFHGTASQLPLRSPTPIRPTGLWRGSCRWKRDGRSFRKLLRQRPFAGIRTINPCWR